MHPPFRSIKLNYPTAVGDEKGSGEHIEDRAILFTSTPGQNGTGWHRRDTLNCSSLFNFIVRHP